MKNETKTTTKSGVNGIIQQYTKKGYTVTHMSDQMVTLTKPKQFQTVWFILFLFFFVLPALLVILSYMVDSDKTVTILIKE